jgi:hypothetical protein
VEPVSQDITSTTSNRGTPENDPINRHPQTRPSTTVLGIQVCNTLPNSLHQRGIFFAICHTPLSLMAPSQRRRSVDSSSSSSESEFSPYARDKKGGMGDAQPDLTARGLHEPDEPGHLPPPPSYSPPSTSTAQPVVQPVPQGPPSGYRIPLGMPAVPPSSAFSSSFPGIERTREAPFTDSDGRSPVFIGSALMQDSVHPCKIVPSIQNEPCRVSYGGREVAHEGRYDLLPFVPALMEFVPASNGHVPHGRMPVKGGFEQNGTELFHAVAVIDGVKVPGKTGIHLVRATFLFWTNTFHFELLMNAGQILMMMHVSSGWLQRPLRRTRARCEREV